MITINKIITELNKYSKNICTLYPGVQDEEIIGLEKKLGFTLPTSFKTFLKECNGFELVSDTIYGIHQKKNLDIYKNYLWEKNESNNPLWSHLIPISPDGSGSHYCFDLKTLTNDNNECKVVYWQYDYDFDDDDPPDVETETFFDFLWELLERIKETNNYDGSDK